MKNMIKSLLAIGFVSLLAGCKLAVMVPSGGDVTSASGNRNCTGGTLCEHNITDSTFNESFTAVARPGYVFTKWNKGAGFLCADSTNPTCTISNVGTAGNAGIEAVIAGGSFFYAMPLFDFVGIDTDGDGVKDHLDEDDDNDGVLDVDDNCPLFGPNEDGLGCPGGGELMADAVTVDGKLWAQPMKFTSLSWNQIRVVCPPETGGICNGGSLNGRNMSGWTWASLEEVNALFNHYMPATPMGPGPARSEYQPSSTADQWNADGWTQYAPAHCCDYVTLQGLTRTIQGVEPQDPYLTYAYYGFAYQPVYGEAVMFIIDGAIDVSARSYDFIGAWFFRTP